LLRITQSADGRSAPTLRFEGKLVGPWVDAARAYIAGLGVGRLDLSALTFVDAAGAQLLQDLLREGAAVSSCSAYVAELLHLEKR
jgi:hypothetical protein